MGAIAAASRCRRRRAVSAAGSAAQRLPSVFLRDPPPRRLPPFRCIADLVRRALAKAGWCQLARAAHLLRHSLATDMLRKGASLDDGEVLRQPQQHGDLGQGGFQRPTSTGAAVGGGVR
jgi:integrase